MIRVILVDDDPAVRLTLGRLLAYQRDIDVVGEAADGQEAVRLIRTTPADVILMDVRMPKMTGVDAVRRVRALGVQTPVIFFSAEDVPSGRLRGAGNARFISKSRASFGDITGAIREAAAGAAHPRRASRAAAG